MIGILDQRLTMLTEFFDLALMNMCEFILVEETYSHRATWDRDDVNLEIVDSAGQVTAL